MSSTVKRVPLDFNGTLNQVWEGYLNPHNEDAEECRLCEGSGYSPYGQALHDRWYGYVPFHPRETNSTPFLPTDEVMVESVTRKLHQDEETYQFHKNAHETWQDMPFRTPVTQYYSTLEAFERNWDVSVDREALSNMDPVVVTEAIRMCNFYNGSFSHHLDEADVEALVSEGRLMVLTHDWSRETGWTEKSPEVRPSAREVNSWSLQGMGHDSINSHVVIAGRCERADQSMMCAVCEGDGHTISESARAKMDAWTPTEPPEGEGYQLWETISEGAPVSPVFETPDELARWMLVHRNRDNLSFESLLKVVEAGGAPVSMAIINGVMMGGDALVAGMKNDS